MAVAYASETTKHACLFFFFQFWVLGWEQLEYFHIRVPLKVESSSRSVKVDAQLRFRDSLEFPVMSY